MPVSSVTEHWIKPDAVTINLNHFGDPDYLQVSVLAGAVVMAFKQDVIAYNAAHNYRTWPIEASNTYLETTSAYNVYARLTRSEVNASALIVYDPILRDIEGRPISYSEDGTEILGEADPTYYYVFLGQISESLDNNGNKKNREWSRIIQYGSLDSSEQKNNFGLQWEKLFKPHYDDPSDPKKLSWIEAKANMGVQGGVTMFVKGDKINIPTIAEGLPFDGKTIWFNTATKQIEVIGGTGGGSGEGGVSSFWELNGIPTWITIDKPVYSYSEIKNTPDLSVYALKSAIPSLSGYATEQWVLGKGYALASDLSTLTTKVNDFLEGSDTDNIINKWKELEAFLTGLDGSNDLATILSWKADKTYVDETFVTIKGNEDVIGIHNFTNGLQIGGVPIYHTTDDIIYLEGNLVIKGGVTMYALDDATVDSIIDKLPIASTTTKGIASFDGSYFTVDANGKVSIIPDSVGLNEVELDAYLTRYKYATHDWVTSQGYLKEHQTIHSLTIKRNGIELGVYTPNSSAKDVDIIVPTKVSDLDNDSKFINGITSTMVTGALGYTPYNAASFTNANIKSTLGISDWALETSKPSYKTSEVTEDTNLYFTDERAVSALSVVTKALQDDINLKWTQNDEKILNWDTAFSWGNHALAGYALRTYVDDTFVTINGDEDVEGVHNFINGLKIGGILVNKSKEDVIYIDANLVVKGGITMYGDENADIPSIYDGLPIDGVTIYWDTTSGSKVLKAKFTDGALTEIDSQMIISALGYTPYNGESNPKGFLTDHQSLVGYATETWVNQQGFLTEHQDLSGYQTKITATNKLAYSLISGTPDLSVYAKTTDVDDRIDALINGAPSAYDTLKEIADVLAGNVDSIGDIITTLGTKADKAIEISAGVGLSGGGTLEADRTLSLATSGVTAGTYKNVTVDKYGRVTSGTNPTTLAGYGITDAKIDNGVITLGDNTITPLTSHQTIYNLTLQAGAFSAVTYDPNGAAKTINIPTTTSHISEGTNLYFTNARAVAALKSITDGLTTDIATKWTQDDNKITNWDTAYGWGDHSKQDYTTNAYVNETFVTIGGNTEQTITGAKNFTGGLKVNGSPIYYDTEKKYWKLEGDLLVTGGVTMHGNDSDFVPSTIMDAILYDSSTLGINSNGQLYVKGGAGGAITSIDYSMVVSALGYIPLQNHQTIYALTIKKNGASLGTYTPNDSAKTIDIAVPTKVSDLNNDSAFISGVTSQMITAALGYTPYNSTNPNGYITSYTDTKNTAGSTNSSSKLFLIGATSQAANPQTYSHDTAYVGTDGCLYSGDSKVLTAHQSIYALTIKNSAGTTQLTYTPNTGAGSITLTKAMVGLGSVENTALSTWTGSSKITTLGTITTGTWNGTKIANGYLANSAITINGTSTSLGGSFNTASITAGTAGTSSATSGYTLAVPYVTMNKYGVVTGYGTHTHTINSIPNSSLTNSSITISGTSVSLGGSITQAALRTALGLGSNAYSSTAYLPLTGGILTGTLRINTDSPNCLYLQNTQATSTSKYAAIRFVVGGTHIAGIGVNTSNGVLQRINSDFSGSYTVWDSGNDGSGSGLDADLLDGFHVSNASKPFGGIPFIGTTGYMDVGSNIDFHYDNTTGSDYSVRLKCTGNHSVTVSLPSSGGTLALTTDNVASATKLQTARTIWGQSFDGTGNVSGHIYLGANAIFGYNNASVISSTETNLSVGYGQSTNGISLGLYGNEVNIYYGKTGLNRGLVLNSSGNITIGSSDLASTNYKLYVNGMSYFSSQMNVVGNFYKYNAAKTYRLCFVNDSDYCSIYNIKADGSAYGNVVFQGNVGIGTTTPAYKLTVAGTANFEGSTYIGTTSSALLGFMRGSANYITTPSNGYLIFNMGGTTTSAAYSCLELYEKDIIMVRSGGNVGIGTANPDHKLYVAGRIKTLTSDVDGLIVKRHQSTGIASVRYLPNNQEVQGWRVGASSEYKMSFEYSSDSFSSTTTNMTLSNAGLLTLNGVMRVQRRSNTSSYLDITSDDIFVKYNGYDSDGYCGHIFYSNGVELFRIAGNTKVATFQGNVLTNGGVTMYSARKLKTIKDERGLSLEELKIIKPTRFTWKDGRDDKIHIGGIADDVMKVLPEVIYKTVEDDTLTMDYGNAAFAIAASLIKPVVNHEERIKMLEEENKRLKEEVEQLKWNIA